MSFALYGFALGITAAVFVYAFAVAFQLIRDGSREL